MQKAEIKRIPFDQVAGSDLYVDAIYEGGDAKDGSAEVLHTLFPKCGIQGGFRKVGQENGKRLAYVVLYTTMSELEWPDFLDVETGIFRYYGDNRKPGRPLNKTKSGGNDLLEKVFDCLNNNKNLDEIPPFFVFKALKEKRNVQFLGLAAPGNPKISPDRDLVAFWRTGKSKGSQENSRFQNYEAYFTILDTGKEPISWKWLHSLIYDSEHSDIYAPKAWLTFKKFGRNGIKALQAPKTTIIPNRDMQKRCSKEGKACLDAIREHYKEFSQGFEMCAVNIVKMMENHFQKFDLTRPWRDGGRDATGTYLIKSGGAINAPLRVECALEAKCYNDNHGVNVKDISRLISRIRYRQFGVIVTTSYVNEQAYKEIIADGHPILIVTATDIARILYSNSITSNDIEAWLQKVDEQNPYFDILKQKES